MSPIRNPVTNYNQGKGFFMSKPKRILVVDDEELNRSLLKGLLASLGYTPESASDGFQALEKLNAGFDLVLMDVMMPGMDGIFIKDNELRYTDVNTAMVRFLDIQLSDIIGKTDKDVFGNDIAVQTQNVEYRVLQGQTIETQESLIYKSQPISVDCIRFPIRGSSNEITGICGIVREMVYRPLMASDALSPGDDYLSPAMRSTLSRALIAAKTNSIILLTGESGSGKDHLARYIHDHSSRCHGPLYAVNCAAIPSELAESELFGHEAGAFTGAVRRKRGLMELAEGGTLLLNEIGELSNVLQGKLLTFLDTFSFTRVGGEKKVTVNIRLLWS